MPVVTRRRSVRILLVVAAGFPLLLAGGAALLTVVIGESCTGGGVGDAPSPVAVRDSPASMLAIYQQVGAQYKLPWEILAGIGKEECDHGQLPDPSCTPQPGRRSAAFSTRWPACTRRRLTPPATGGSPSPRFTAARARRQAVALLGCEEQLLPSWRSISSPDPERLAEERRLFYVAATRAKDRLLITHVAERGRRLTGGPSRFIAEAGLVPTARRLAA